MWLTTSKAFFSSNHAAQSITLYGVLLGASCSCRAFAAGSYGIAQLVQPHLWLSEKPSSAKAAVVLNKLGNTRYMSWCCRTAKASAMFWYQRLSADCLATSRVKTWQEC